MIIYTMGFAQKNAETFFELLKKNGVQILIDIRLNNKSQLAGFTKGTDLEYFLKNLCNCDYYHGIEYAPTKEILDSYKNKETTWDDYEKSFIPLMKERNAKASFEKQFGKYDRVCLLCSEPTPEHCHRRLVAELVVKDDDEIRHI